MKRSTLIVFAAMAVAFNAPAFAQRSSHPSPGGPPSGRGPGNGSDMSGSHPAGATAHTDMSHASPNDVLSHNTAIADKIKALTGKDDAQTACGGFKNLGQCVAALHVSKNLGLSFSDLQGKMTGSNSESLGKAIEGLGGPNVNAKSEAKKANKQANEDLNAVDSTS